MFDIIPTKLNYKNQPEPRTNFIQEIFKDSEKFSFHFDINTINKDKLIEVVNCILSCLHIDPILFSHDWKDGKLVFTPIRKQDQELFCVLNLLYSEDIYNKHPEYAVNVQIFEGFSLPFQSFLNYKNTLRIERELTKNNQEDKIDLLDSFSHNIKNAKITTFYLDHGIKEYQEAKLI